MRRAASAAAAGELQLHVAEAGEELGHQRQARPVRQAQREERWALEEQLPGQAEPAVHEQVRPVAPLAGPLVLQLEAQQGRVEHEPAQAQEEVRLLGQLGVPRQAPVEEVSWELAAEASMAVRALALPAAAALSVSWKRYDWPACWR